MIVGTSFQGHAPVLSDFNFQFQAANASFITLNK
jgi:hypothetical protein